jgi:P pilus assembly chaperone PapD
MKRIIIFIFLFLFLFLPSRALATLGVGIGTGRIEVNDILRPGTIYTLPSLSVINTGDEASDYKVGISYLNGQQELLTPKEWFIFSPEEFHLKPGEVQVVTIKINLPLKMQPGKYFNYLEAHPTMKNNPGKTTIGVAAAARLYFTVEAANIFQAVYYKVITFWKVYQPWTGRTAILLGVVIVLILIKKFFKIQVNFKMPESKKEKETKEEDQNE